MLRGLRVLASWVAALGLGCSAVDERDDRTAPLKADEARILELQLHSCELFPTCFGPLRASLAGAASPTQEFDFGVERCETLAEATFEETFFPALTSSVAERRVVYHPERLEDCLQADAQRLCHEISTLLDACLEAFEGRASLGDRCTTQHDCGPSAFCDLGLTEEPTCPAVCKPRQAVGSACVHPVQCGAGMRCFDPAFSSGLALARVCAPPAAEGETCHGLHCATGLVCTLDSARSTSCQPLERGRQVGETCTPTSQCEGLGCRSDVAAGAPTCAATSEGATCSDASECGAEEFCGCTDGSCTTRVCTPWPEAGQACGMGIASDQVCAQGLFCSTGTCTDRRPLDALCLDDFECTSNRCERGLCVPPEC